jgi:hypothetical protein
LVISVIQLNPDLFSLTAVVLPRDAQRPGEVGEVGQLDTP